MADQEEPKQERSDRRPDDAEAMARLQEEINNLPVSEHLVYMVQSLSALAVGRLGLGPHSAARRDPDQARLAIDAMKALVAVLEQVRPAGEIAALRGMLSQLQLAYAAAISGGAPERPAAPEPAAAPETGDKAPAATEPPLAAPSAPERPAPAPKKTPGAASKAAPKKAAASKVAPEKSPKPRGGSQSGS